MVTVNVGGRYVGDGHPCFVIAEIGVNHDGSEEQACRLIDEAARSGADAVKFQTFRTEELVTPEAPRAEYQKRNAGGEETQYEMLKRLELPSEAFERLKSYSEERDLIFLSSPFDEASAAFLDKLGISAFKLPSGEITNISLLRQVAGTGRPVLLSTGMAEVEEIEAAVSTLQEAGGHSIVLLQCTTNYPVAEQDMQIRAIRFLQDTFKVPVGFSDHSEGILGAALSVAAGACLVEKHFTLDRTMAGPDHAASSDPVQFKEMVDLIRRSEKMLGSGEKSVLEVEKANRALVRKSLVVRQTLKEGHILSEGDLKAMRPGGGIAPAELPQLIGRRVQHELVTGHLIQWEDCR